MGCQYLGCQGGRKDNEEELDQQFEQLVAESKRLKDSRAPEKKKKAKKDRNHKDRKSSKTKRSRKEYQGSPGRATGDRVGADKIQVRDNTDSAQSCIKDASIKTKTKQVYDLNDNVKINFDAMSHNTCSASSPKISPLTT